MDTRYLFDGMSSRGKTAKVSTGSFQDRLSALPDDLLHHTLGFLEAGDAVRTCVLSRRWRHLWRHIPCLRITDIDAFRSVEKLNEFVCKLFMLRDAGSVLDECELDLRGFLQLDDFWVHLWIRRVLACRARVLRLDTYTNLPTSSEEPLVELANQPLLSQHLVRLELHGVFLKERFLDFSSCPVLEDLKIADCVIHTVKILSQSSKHMSIRGCQFLWDMQPPRISAPSLVSLQLHGSNMIPVLESMPFLETAAVNLCQKYEEFCDFCDCGSLEVEKCDCGMSELYWDNGRKCDFSVFLQGLSSATCLELIASPEMIRFTRDLQCCPPFSKLRSLFLNDWCLVFDLQILLFFLHHTPVLEKLTLQLCKEPRSTMKIGGSSMEQSLKLKQLKIVVVKCQMIDDRVHNITKILSSCSISLAKINIQKLYINTRYLFDGMSRRIKTAKVSTGSFEDRLSALPDDLLHHTLGFLDAGDAVRTCVLSRRWRHLWRPIPCLRITDIEAFRSVEKLNRFVDQLLLLRDAGSVLDECELDLRGLLRLDNALVDLWMRRVLACNATVLRVHLYANLPASQEEPLVILDDQPFLSQHLVRLELSGVYMEERLFDFSGCPALEDLKIVDCVLHTDKIFSRSSKHISIRGCQFLWDMYPTQLSAPNLVSLQLHDCNMIPILESMPALETVSVNLSRVYEEYCDICDNGGLELDECQCGMIVIYWDNDNDRKRDFSVFLGGLSSATCLELIASPEMVTFRRDLRCCPTFNKLRSLFLNDWCLVADYQILLYFLQHTPVLEKLTLQLCKEPKSGMELEGSSSMEQSLTLRKLKIIEVKCHVIDERVHNISKILSSCSISLAKIIIQKL